MGCFDVRAVPSNRKNAEANTEYQDCLIQQIRSEYKGKLQMCLAVLVVTILCCRFLAVIDAYGMGRPGESCAEIPCLPSGNEIFYL
jgi:hypothetical protein